MAPGKSWIFLGLMGTFVFNVCGKSKKDEERERQKVPQAEYTKDDPGEWEGMENEHLPKIEVLKNESRNNVIVTVAMKSKSDSHFIERIGVMDRDRKDVAGESFTRNALGYRSVFTVYPITDEANLKVYVKCNLHDLWTARLRVK